VYFPPKLSVNFNDIIVKAKQYGSNIVIMGDMNARVGSFQNVGCGTRESRDKVINYRGRQLINSLGATSLTREYREWLHRFWQTIHTERSARV